jgi:hypothetical protein
MTKICTSKAMYSSAKSLMNLEKTHCHASKRPNRGFANATYLRVEGLTTFEESHFHAAKMPKNGSINTMRGGSHAP